MSDPFVGEVRAFGFNFAPRGWATCSGQLLPIAQHTALFSILGVSFGGDGKTTFALPALGGYRVPIGTGQGHGLTNRELGEPGGEPSVTVTVGAMPFHNHALNATNSPADVSSPTPTTALARTTGRPGYVAPPSGLLPLNIVATESAGNTHAHNNLMPYLVVNYCIALEGIFPIRQ